MKSMAPDPERPSTAGAAPASFAELLALEELDDNLYRGRCHAGVPLRAFGGQVAAQALVAAGATVTAQRRVHSLHGYFIRPGRPDRHIIYQADRVRDGRSFSTRRVTAVQGGEAIFTLSASFQTPEGEPVHQRSLPLAPPPEELADDGRPTGEFINSRFQETLLPVLEIRPVPPEPADSASSQSSRFWVRVRGRLPDDPLGHACALTYISDVRLARTASATHRAAFGNLMIASLDHAVWFHREFRADDWLLVDLLSTTAGFGRGLAHGAFFTRDGLQVASVVQEILIRPEIDRTVDARTPRD
jgi:acyl-CoA thioesterase-2